MLDQPRFVEFHAAFSTLKKYSCRSTYILSVIYFSDIVDPFHSDSSVFFLRLFIYHSGPETSRGGCYVDVYGAESLGTS